MAAAAPLSDLHAMLAKIGREFHAKRINRVVNDPSVYPWVRGHHEGELDLTPVIADHNNVLLMGQHGGVLFIQLQPGLFEAHTQILPDGRGKWAVEMVRAAVFWMFTRTECFELMTRCPRGNLGARALARAVGGKFEFTNPRGWTRDGKTIPADIFSITIQDWMRTAPGLVERGHWFHERLKEEYLKLGRSAPPPENDENHARYIGMACEMFLGNQAQKAVILYSRWARMADYAPFEICSLRPTAIDISDAIVVVRDDGDFYVAGSNQSNASLH